MTGNAVWTLSCDYPRCEHEAGHGDSLPALTERAASYGWVHVAAGVGLDFCKMHASAAKDADLLDRIVVAIVTRREVRL